MKNFLTIVLGLLGTVVSALFGGFIIMKFYEWCLIPLGTSFNYTFPTISYGLFIMIDIGLALIKYKPLPKDIEGNDAIIYALKVLFGKAWILFILWIFSLIIF